uniref:Uncharacterized protein n=1 Tax=Romanomermis culicivorax TaxID=13658 RepID=A0A915L9Q4_ROMCU
MQKNVLNRIREPSMIFSRSGAACTNHFRIHGACSNFFIQPDVYSQLKCALQSCSLVQSKENHKLVGSKKDYKLVNSKEKQEWTKMIKIIVPADYTIPGYIWCQTTSMIRPIKLKLWYNNMALYCK